MFAMHQTKPMKSSSSNSLKSMYECHETTAGGAAAGESPEEDDEEEPLLEPDRELELRQETASHAGGGWSVMNLSALSAEMPKRAHSE
jgi:hypothetical protein